LEGTENALHLLASTSDCRVDRRVSSPQPCCSPPFFARKRLGCRCSSSCEYPNAASTSVGLQSEFPRHPTSCGMCAGMRECRGARFLRPSLLVRVLARSPCRNRANGPASGDWQKSSLPLKRTQSAASRASGPWRTQSKSVRLLTFRCLAASSVVSHADSVVIVSHPGIKATCPRGSGYSEPIWS